MRYIKGSEQIEKSKQLHWICIILIWILYIYSSVIQYKYFEIANLMLVLGALILLTFLFVINGKGMSLSILFSQESLWILAYLIYMLLVGLVASISRNAHITQCITSMEYLFVLLVMEYLIKDTDTDSFYILLIITSIILGIILIREPVLYTIGRYSISMDMNPNYIAMCLAAGIWAILYIQQKRGFPLIAMYAIIGFLLFCILQTGSRKGLISAGIVLGLWMVFCFLPNLKKMSVGKQVAYFVLLAFLSVGLIFFFMGEYQNSTLADRMNQLEDEATGGERYQLYSLGFYLFKQNPLFGIGFGGFRMYRGEHSHSTIIEVLVSGGIIGSFLYFTSYVISIRKCLAILKYSRRNKKLSKVFVEGKMLLVLWASMLFYSTCVIHPGQLLSFISFGIIFGKTANLERKISEIMSDSWNSEMRNQTKNGKSIYIKG